jgi:hypothetical protein
MAAGTGFTVTTVVVKQPVPNVYVIVVVPPGFAPPVTVVVGVETAVGVTVATVVTLLLHVPPGVASLKIVVRPEHMVVLPVIGRGTEFTVMVTVAVQPVAVNE